MADIKIVIVEDDQKISEIQSRFVEKIAGFEVVGVANTLGEAPDMLEVFQPELILLDVYFPDGSGLDLLWKIRDKYRMDVILITAAKEVSPLQEAIRGGVFDYILKPISFSRFRETLVRYMEYRDRLLKINTLEQHDIDQIMHPLSREITVEAPLPKGIDQLTLEKVESIVQQLEEEGVNAESMGERLGTSRTTARRYLEFLVLKGTVKPNLIYGTVGRPERLYFCVK